MPLQARWAWPSRLIQDAGALVNGMIEAATHAVLGLTPRLPGYITRVFAFFAQTCTPCASHV